LTGRSEIRSFHRDVSGSCESGGASGAGLPLDEALMRRVGSCGLELETGRTPFQALVSAVVTSEGGFGRSFGFGGSRHKPPARGMTNFQLRK